MDIIYLQHTTIKVFVAEELLMFFFSTTSNVVIDIN